MDRQRDGLGLGMLKFVGRIATQGAPEGRDRPAIPSNRTPDGLTSLMPCP